MLMHLDLGNELRQCFQRTIFRGQHQSDQLTIVKVLLKQHVAVNGQANIGFALDRVQQSAVK